MEIKAYQSPGSFLGFLHFAVCPLPEGLQELVPVLQVVLVVVSLHGLFLRGHLRRSFRIGGSSPDRRPAVSANIGVLHPDEAVFFYLNVKAGIVLQLHSPRAAFTRVGWKVWIRAARCQAEDPKWMLKTETETSDFSPQRVFPPRSAATY